jgi:hypothetical protein
MTCDAEAIYVAALSLPATSRAELIRKLVASLDQSASGAIKPDRQESRREPCLAAVPPGLQADRLFDALGARVRT